MNAAAPGAVPGSEPGPEPGSEPGSELGTAPGYVALGDSISIDDYSGGPGTGGASLLFANRDEDFPEWQGRDLRSQDPRSQFALLATDGATTGTLLDFQLPRIPALPFRPTLVTVTIGGNDLLRAYGETTAAHHVIGRVEQAVDRALGTLAELVAPAARIVVGTVYDPSDGTGDTAGMGLPPWPDGVETIAALNDVLRRVAVRHGAAVADVAAVFSGHGLRAGNPAQPGARPAERDLWFCNVIEPNAWGAGGVREAFWTAMQD